MNSNGVAWILDRQETLRRSVKSWVRGRISGGWSFPTKLRPFWLGVTFYSEFEIHTPSSQMDLLFDERGQSLRDASIGSVVNCGSEHRYRFMQNLVQPTTNSGSMHVPPSQKLFPGERANFPKQSWMIKLPCGAAVKRGSVRLHWTLYLDDTRPTAGEIDLVDHLASNVDAENL